VGPEFSIKLSERKKNKSGENKARRRRRSMRFPVRLSPPATAAAATAGAVLAAVALRRYLRTRSSMATSAHRRGSAGGITLVVSGKSTEDQHLLAAAGGALVLGEGDSVEDITVSLDSGAGAGAGAGFDAGAYMAALRASRFGRWMLWSPRLASTHDLVTQWVQDLLGFFLALFELGFSC
jgi:biotin--protein ligase